ncbi:(2Fe-2S)-binding protein [Thiorhodovibrio frisius]|uniref:Aerobic-type carbon monoxide dehydrogenase, small subunit CoxS/CutS-like protein n=1 Tax=Thiorhodovibrio frisius TaxID=631362 RepID=H8Z6X8_9GAMM|nr:(2Fe-2S)-binding protein [Thiorhodovibrio frisius]EIC19763.1 aerobic-type carbon monoxide dehydrogenase, small subunit CoxS/CutS-like protein [Thiorhodovibrio frisius]WPL20267.1 Isoquinoline 1-oxidoreductase subunit alpha [Thiorhodovibrio frisius]
MIKLTVNGKQTEIDVDPQTPLLWVLRDHLGLTGTKFSCGIAQCGACTVHVDGVATRSCSTPVSAVAGRNIVTIEGLSEKADHPVQQAWVELDVPQCGFCQSGQIMAAASLLENNPKPSDAEIDQGMGGVLCRCGTYNDIRAAVKRAAEIASEEA